MAPTRVLVVFGSESGNARMAAKKMKETYQGNFTIIDAVQANDVAGKVATKQLVQDCDVLVVTTSSHGEGDPPDNFASFLLALIYRDVRCHPRAPAAIVADRDGAMPARRCSCCA